MSELDLSIVIVNWNTRALLAQCLQSVYDTVQGLEFEVFVVAVVVGFLLLSRRVGQLAESLSGQLEVLEGAGGGVIPPAEVLGALQPQQIAGGGGLGASAESKVGRGQQQLEADLFVVGLEGRQRGRNSLQEALDFRPALISIDPAERSSQTRHRSCLVWGDRRVLIGGSGRGRRGRRGKRLSGANQAGDE